MSICKNIGILLVMGFFIFCFSVRAGSAGEHPAEHPAKHSDKKSIDKDNMAKAIKNYVKDEAELKGGYFLVYDKKAKKPLALELVRVHKDRLSKIEDDVYFACADFKTPEGKIYDLDVFMEGSDPDKLEVTEISVHKEAGKPRYTWYEKKGIWKKKLKK